MTFNERSMVAFPKVIMSDDGDVGKTSNTQVVEIESKDQAIDFSHIQVDIPNATREEKKDEPDHKEIQHENAHVL